MPDQSNIGTSWPRPLVTLHVYDAVRKQPSTPLTAPDKSSPLATEPPMRPIFDRTQPPAPRDPVRFGGRS